MYWLSWIGKLNGMYIMVKVRLFMVRFSKK